MGKVAVVALGGNAIIRGGQAGTFAEQSHNAEAMVKAVCQLRADGWTVVVVHGNGPQVGNLAIQQAESAHRVPELPLCQLDAMTQGQLGSLLAMALRRTCGAAPPGVVCLVTHVVVDGADPAFTHPTKPIGPFFGELEARRQAAARGWTVGEDAGRGYRRLVASPPPLRIVELEAIRALVDRGFVVIAAGGGGVPVVEDGPGYRGIDAVIDKDLAAQRLATALGAEALVLVTDVPRVMLDYGGPDARPITRITDEQAQRYVDAHQFPEGSMAPKVRAAIGFIRGGGQVAVITNAERAGASLASSPVADAATGTRIVAAEQRLGAAR